MLRKIKSRRTAGLRNAPSGDSDEETRSRPLGSNYGKTMRVVPYRMLVARGKLGPPTERRAGEVEDDKDKGK